jgi:hypothetical protein
MATEGKYPVNSGGREWTNSSGKVYRTGSDGEPCGCDCGEPSPCDQCTPSTSARNQYTVSFSGGSICGPCISNNTSVSGSLTGTFTLTRIDDLGTVCVWRYIGPYTTLLVRCRNSGAACSGSVAETTDTIQIDMFVEKVGGVTKVYITAIVSVAGDTPNYTVFNNFTAADFSCADGGEVDSDVPCYTVLQAAPDCNADDPTGTVWLDATATITPV